MPAARLGLEAPHPQVLHGVRQPRAPGAVAQRLPVGLDLPDRLVPELLEAELPCLDTRRLRDGPALGLVIQVVLKQFLQVVRAVVHALLAVAEVSRQFPVPGLLEDQRPGERRLEGTPPALAAAAELEDDLGPGQHAAVALAEDAGLDEHAAATKPGEAAEPGHTLALDGRVEVAHEQDIDVPLSVPPRLLQEGALAAAEVGSAGLGDALPGHQLGAPRVGQHHVAAGQRLAVGVPEQVPVEGQPDPRQRGRPQAGGDSGVRQVQGQKVWLPAVGQAAADIFPRVGEADGQVGVAVGVERQTVTPVALCAQVLVGEGGGDRAKQVFQRHSGSSERGGPYGLPGQVEASDQTSSRIGRAHGMQARECKIVPS